MKQSLVRSTVAAGAMLLALSPIGLAFAAEGEPGAVPGAPPPAAEAVFAPAPMPAPAPAVSDEARDAASALAADAAGLAPGGFVWRPELAESGPVEIVVSVPLQRAFVYRGGTLIGVSTVSTGRPGHATPTGRFPILEKRRRHFSNLYNNAPMPFMQRLTWDGIALHAGEIPGRPASHGCVRLPLAFAQLLFGATSVGGTVHVTDLAPAAGEALAMVGGWRGMGGPLEPVAD